MSQKDRHSLVTDKTLFQGKKVLVVDDDIRNIFALTGLLEVYDVQVVYNTSGKEAIERLKKEDDVDLVLMDIMMPEMNGYETMEKIRKEENKTNLPIIALTAKSMRGDREKCIKAGANEYLSKPLNKDKLLSVLRVWLP
jgi:CheY-like chemotaxis protein